MEWSRTRKAAFRVKTVECNGDHDEARRRLTELCLDDGYILLGQPRCRDWSVKGVQVHQAWSRAVYIGKRKAKEVNFGIAQELRTPKPQASLSEDPK